LKLTFADLCFLFCTPGVADALGLPFVPPYLADRKANFSGGVDFAVVGAPALYRIETLLVSEHHAPHSCF
jgi:hypothetical protein